MIEIELPSYYIPTEQSSPQPSAVLCVHLPSIGPNHWSSQHLCIWKVHHFPSRSKKNSICAFRLSIIWFFFIATMMGKQKESVDAKKTVSTERLVIVFHACRSMNSNKFSGSIPPSLGRLSKLYWFDLADNKLSGELPIFDGTNPGLDNLTNTKHLYVHSYPQN